MENTKDFELADMLIEGGANAVSGGISFVGGVAGGITGVKPPRGGEDTILFHSGMLYFGGYPIKFLASKIKNSLKEMN